MTSERDDRLLAPTHWTAVVIVPVLLAAFVILYVFPGRTHRLWGWTVRPDMSALIMGAGYLAGAYFFFRVATCRQWHRVSVGFPAVTVFTAVLIVTTVLHWDRFNHDHVSFWAWLLLYGITPVLLPVLWVKNQRTDPGALPSGEAVVPRPLRIAVGIGGALQLAFAGVMFFWPSLAADVWPWPLSAATSRSISAFVAFPAVTWLWFLFEDRWSCFRIPQQTAALGLLLIGLGALRTRGDFESGWQTPFYAVALVVSLAMMVALLVGMDRRAARVAGEPVRDGPRRG